MDNTSGAILTMDMIEEAARAAIIGHGRPDNPFIFWQPTDNTYMGTPYDSVIIIDKDLRAFVQLHIFLIKLKVCKYSSIENYDFLNSANAKRLKKKCIKLFKKEKSIKNKKKDQKRRMYENLPFYQRSLPRHTRGCV